MKNPAAEKTILVSGASGIVGYGILKSLKGKGYKLIGTTIYENSVANAFCDIFEKAPPTNEESYLPWLIQVIKKHHVDMIIPSIEIDVIAWKKFKETIEKETNTHVLLNNPNLIDLCADKWLFYQELKKNNSAYAIPTSLELGQEIKFPLLLKPRTGYASKGIAIVKDKESLDLHKNEIGPKLLIQPVVGNADEEYTTSAFFDKDSNLCAHMSLKRKLSKEGFTETAETTHLPEIEKVLIELAAIFKPIGPTNFQFRTQHDKLKLLEINPRISSATSIRTAFGYNESSMSVEYFLNNKKPTQPSLKTGRAVRYTEDMIYYDSPHL